MNQTVSHTYQIDGTEMYPNARKGGLARIGHLFSDVDGIIAIKRDSSRYILIFGNGVSDEEGLNKELRKAIPSLTLVSNEIGQELYNTRRTEGTKAQLYFDRETFV